MDFLKFLITRLFLKNFLIVFSISASLLIIIFIWLRIYTHHREAISVPDFYGMTIEEVQKSTGEKKLRFQVVDSVYVNNAKKGIILDQNPPPFFKVKKHRTIFLTMNALNPEKVKMPNVTGISLREARANLESRGLSVGRIIYVPDIALNYVLRQVVKGKDIPEGASVIKGSRIDLVLGKGLSNDKIGVPQIEGMRLYEAEQRLIESYLNLGAVIYDNSIITGEDSLNARIFRQRPDITESGINLGASVDIWLTIALSKIPGADTLSILPEEDQ
jgi:eukaryotic-like serine/threonine-protein kinase